MDCPGFTCFRNQGFSITFSNGWTISVQFGAGHYCQARNSDVLLGGRHSSSNAEVAILNPSNDFIQPEGFYGDGCVMGWISPEDVSRLIQWVSSQRGGVE